MAFFPAIFKVFITKNEDFLFLRFCLQSELSSLPLCVWSTWFLPCSFGGRRSPSRISILLFPLTFRTLHFPFGKMCALERWLWSAVRLLTRRFLRIRGNYAITIPFEDRRISVAMTTKTKKFTFNERFGKGIKSILEGKNLNNSNNNYTIILNCIICLILTQLLHEREKFKLLKISI